MKTRFTKIHGLGNDFILFDRRNFEKSQLNQDVIKQLCRRKWGIGSDGILILSKKNQTNQMIIYNPDGTRPEMCGNGLRCIVKYLHDNQEISLNQWIPIITDVGILKGRVLKTQHSASIVEVEIGKPKLINKQITINGMNFIFVDVGNPHLVTFIHKGQDPVDLALSIGPEIEPYNNGVNVGFAQLKEPDTLYLAVWERGAGFTGACGTGATAAAMASKELRLTSNKIKVIQKGGILSLAFEDNGMARLTGPSERVFDGELSEDIFS